MAVLDKETLFLPNDVFLTNPIPNPSLALFPLKPPDAIFATLDFQDLVYNCQTAQNNHPTTNPIRNLNINQK